MQKTEVTHGQMELFLEKGGDPDACRKWRERFNDLKSTLGSAAEGEARAYPASCISWWIAALFAQTKGGHLPTEAQFEFAARSLGKNIVFVWQFPNEPAALSVAPANINNYADAAKVGSYDKDATQQGILDLTGNVREWCRDIWTRYEAKAEPVVDPQFPIDPNAPPAGVAMVVRGGSYFTSLELGHTTNRDEPHGPDEESPDIGFRIVIECPEGAPEMH
jgi:formylglycine-generating enzyme required for sulfatase activity